MFHPAFLEDEEAPVSLACENDEHDECDGDVLGRPVGGGKRVYIGKCGCHCHKEPDDMSGATPGDR